MSNKVFVKSFYSSVSESDWLTVDALRQVLNLRDGFNFCFFFWRFHIVTFWIGQSHSISSIKPYFVVYLSLSLCCFLCFLLSFLFFFFFLYFVYDEIINIIYKNITYMYCTSSQCTSEELQICFVSTQVEQLRSLLVATTAEQCNVMSSWSNQRWHDQGVADPQVVPYAMQTCSDTLCSQN